MEKKSKPVLLATLLLTAVSLSACVIPADRDDRGGGRHRHSDNRWDNNRDWNGGHNNGGWHRDDDSWWKRKH